MAREKSIHARIELAPTSLRNKVGSTTDQCTRVDSAPRYLVHVVPFG